MSEASPGTTTGLIRILTVDDHALLRSGIAGLVNAEPDMKMIAEAATGVEAIKQFRQHRPDITLMDLQMPDMSGIEAIIGIRGDFPEARIIVLIATRVSQVRKLDSARKAERNLHAFKTTS
jgi:DNA-binding NarL/FixJ family response regulator